MAEAQDDCVTPRIIGSVDCDARRVDVVEAEQEPRQSGFSGAAYVRRRRLAPPGTSNETSKRIARLGS